MAAPTFVSETETVWTASTSATRVTASIAVQAGDLLVAIMMGQAASSVGTLTASGGGLTWTQQQEASFGSRTVISTATATSTTSFTVTVTRSVSGISQSFGCNVLVFRSHGGVGAANNASSSVGAPSVNLTTTQANSAIVVGNADASGADGASRVWRTNAGALTEQTYNRIAGTATMYAGYHADAGSIGTYACGLTAPSTQNYTIVALEILGTGAAPAVAYPQLERLIRGVNRGIR